MAGFSESLFYKLNLTFISFLNTAKDQSKWKIIVNCNVFGRWEGVEYTKKEKKNNIPVHEEFFTARQNLRANEDIVFQTIVKKHEISRIL